MMEKPPGTPDPRSPDAPIRVDDEEEDRARSNVTVGEMMADAPREEITFEPLELPDIPPGRLRELRRRRDYLIPLLREFFGGR